MTGSKFKIALKTSLIAALIAAMLAVSGGAVNASANSTSSPSETVTAETNGGTLTLGSYREAGKLYASASPVTYNGSFRSEIESDRIALMIYDSLYDHSITNPDNNDYTLPVDPSYMDGDGSDLDKTQQSVFKSVALGNTAFNYDHPEAFWVGLSGCSASASSTDGETYAVTSVTVRRVETYTGAFNQRSTVTTCINTAVNAISAGETRYDTLKNIHDYVCNNSVYDDDEAKYSNTPEAHTAAPLFNGKGTYVCEGYAKAFKILCDKYNIPCVLVCGTGTTNTGSENHMWNYVQMDDGKWYAVDVTWDDQEYGTIYNYFLKGSNTVGSDHTPGKPGIINEDGTQESVDIYYPTLAMTDYDPSNTTPSSSETTPSSSETTPSSSETTPSSSETTPSSSETTPSSSETTPSSSETTPSSSETTPSSSETTPSSSETTPSSSETTPSSSEMTPSSSETTPSSSTTTTSANNEPEMLNVKLDDPDNGFVKSAQIPENAVAKAGNDDVELSKIKVIVTKLDDTKKKSLSDGIRSINSGFDPDNSNFVAYDIKLVDNNGHTVTITDGKVKICLAYPTTLTKKYTDYVYSVYHQKSNGVERIKPVSYNAQGVWFETDKFSAFGLASVEKSNGEPSPGTGEAILMTVIAIILLVLAAGAIAFIVIRNKTSNEDNEKCEESGDGKNGNEN